MRPSLFTYLGRLIKRTWRSFFSNEAQHHAAALAFYTMFSLIPMMMLLLASLGYALKFWDPAIDIEKRLLAITAQNYSVEVSEILKKLIGFLRHKTITATGVGLAALVYAASRAFQQLEYGIKKIWKIESRSDLHWLINFFKESLKSKLVAIGMVFGVGGLLMLSIVITGLSESIFKSLKNSIFFSKSLFSLRSVWLSLILNSIGFSLLYKYFLRRRVIFKDVFVASFATAILWECIKRLMTLYLRGAYSSAYDAVEAVLVLMMWIYVSSQIVFLGASLLKSISDLKVESKRQNQLI